MSQCEMMALPRELILTQLHYENIVDRAISAAPLEVCGFLGGVGGCVHGVFPVLNVAPEPLRAFLMEGREQLAAMAGIEKRDWEILAIYHSHPPGERTDPSLTDVEQASYPEMLNVIVVPPLVGDVVSIRAFSIAKEQVRSVPLTVVPQLTGYLRAGL